ncbi:MAG: hypothetical protein Q9227_000361 [Pyrenula ochraceoflavens]
MDVLSASSYPLPSVSSQALTSSRSLRADTLLFGGLIRTEPPADCGEGNDEAGSEGVIQPKKRTKQSKKNCDHESPKKQRGRPRVIAQGQTAADRRRTQIRLAQRAYRMRKETTIDDLKNRVGDLEERINQMNASFLQFNDRMIQSGVLVSHPELAEQLRRTTTQFLLLAQNASESDCEEDMVISLSHEDQMKNDSSLPVSSSDRKDTTAHANGTTQSWGFLFPNEDIFGQDQCQDGMPANAFHSSQLDQNPFESLKHGPLIPLVNGDQGWTSDISAFCESRIERPFKSDSPYTYSFQESSFARRLHRASLEHSFRLLTLPSTNPERVARMFRFTFCWSNKKRILKRFQELLRKTTSESLENFDVPFIHVGGAGLHFPRIDQDGRKIYPPNMISPSDVQVYRGPLNTAIAETPRAERSVEQLLDAIGFGGTWFDANDVESYLQSKGIYLDGQSSFVDIQASALSPALASSQQSKTTSIVSPGFTPSPVSSSPDLSMNLGDSQAALVGSGTSTEASSWSHGLGAPYLDVWQQQQVDQISQGLISLDVQKLVNRES